MKKALILLLLAVIIAAQWTVLSSFFTVNTEYPPYGTINVSGTSAVIVAKADYVSLRVKFYITAEPGRTALVIFPDGSQENVTSSYRFEMLFPRTNFFVGTFSDSLYVPSVGDGNLQILLSDQKPSDIVVVPNVDENFFSTILDSESLDIVTFWFKIEGNARVFAAGYGVPI